MSETMDQNLFSDDCSRPIQEAALERGAELAEFETADVREEQPEADSQTSSHSPMERVPMVSSKSTSDWKATFEHKVKEAIDFADTHPLDQKAEQTIRRLLAEKGYLPGEAGHYRLKRKDVAIALLLTQKGSNRLMASEYTTVEAHSIINAEALVFDINNS